LRSDRADSDYVITLDNKIRLLRPVALGDIKRTAALSSWSFGRYQQGIMRRRRDVSEEGAWSPLRRLIVAENGYAADSIPLLDRHEFYRARDSSLKPISATRSIADGVASSELPLLRVFLSYGSEDVQEVRRLYKKLHRQSWIEPWFDKVHLVVGDDWEEAIERALQSSDAVVICLSARSVRKVGFVNTEIG